MSGSVHPFTCGRAHPQLPDVTCARQRHHAGDHRADHENRLRVWADTPAGPFALNEFTGELTELDPPKPRHNLACWLIAAAIVLSVWLPAAIILWRHV